MICFLTNLIMVPEVNVSFHIFLSRISKSNVFSNPMTIESEFL